MTIEYSKDEFIELIKKYYLEKIGIKVEVNINSRIVKSYLGYRACITTLEIYTMIKKENKVLLAKRVPKWNEINDMVKIMLEEEGYILDDMGYKDGFKINDDLQMDTYFNGVILNVRKNALIKKL